MHDPRDYYERLTEISDREGFDGCSLATGLRKECCAEHDFHYRYHRRLDGQFISRAEADLRFLRCLQRRGWVGWWSPVAWIRYGAVRVFGERSWKKSYERSTHRPPY
jgi:hypothetical protein